MTMAASLNTAHDLGASLHRRSGRIVGRGIAMAALLSAVFATDLYTPAGVGHGMLYGLIVVLAVFSGQARLVLGVTIVSATLVVAGGATSASAGGTSLDELYLYGNRAASVMIVLAAGSLAMLFVRLSRRQADVERALDERDRLLGIATRMARIGGWSARVDDEYVRWSDQVYRILEVEPQRPITVAEALTFFAPEDRQRIEESFERCLEHGIGYDQELQVITARGRRRWVRTIGEPLRESGQLVGAHGAFVDIDRGKRLTGRLTATLQNMTDGLLLLDSAWRVMYLNPRAEKLLGTSHDDFSGQQPGPMLAVLDEAGLEQRLHAAMEDARTVTLETRLRQQDRWLELRAHPTEEGLAVHFRDVTKRHRSEARLKLLEAAVERINDAILITEGAPIDPPGPRIVYANRGFEHQTGYSAEEVVGRTPRMLQGEETQRDRLDRIRRALEARTSVQEELVNYRKSGESFLVEVDIVPLGEADEDRYYVSVQRDVTRKRSMEEQLRQSQRLESIGQLTGGIAHDFNNLLTVILGNAELLRDELADTETLRSTATMIADAAVRGSELTERLLTFARRQQLDPGAVELEEFLDHMQSFLARTLGGHIEVRIETDHQLPPALVDRAQLENAVLNLALNARDAMPDGGVLTLRARRTHIGPERADMLELEAGDYLLLEAADSGHGMSEDVRSRAFEPFFSTKDKDKGTGLGLSMVYGFARQSGGHVDIDSRPGEGSRVQLYLPRAIDRNVGPTDCNGEQRPAGGAGCIVLVEDNAMVRDFAASQLRSMGYSVQVAADANQALELIEDTSFDIDLLFTDVVMPGGINGSELADAAQRIRPGLRVLYTSGYSENALAARTELGKQIRLLRKPYRRADMARAVADALEDVWSEREEGS